MYLEPPTGMRVLPGQGNGARTPAPLLLTHRFHNCNKLEPRGAVWGNAVFCATGASSLGLSVLVSRLPAPAAAMAASNALRRSLQSAWVRLAQPVAHMAYGHRNARPFRLNARLLVGAGHATV